VMWASGHGIGGLQRMVGASPGWSCATRGAGRALGHLGREGERERGRRGWGGDANGAEPAGVGAAVSPAAAAGTEQSARQWFLIFFSVMWASGASRLVCPSGRTLVIIVKKGWHGRLN
jgi:hypothetical protein